MHWIAVDETRFVLPLGSYRIHLYATPDGAWRVFHVGKYASRDLNGAQPLTFARAKQFAESYIRACAAQAKSDGAVVERMASEDALWRRAPMSEKQRARLVLATFGDVDPTLTAGEASDLFQILAAKREVRA